MANGRNVAVENEEALHQERLAEVVANRAANLVAARDMSREDAIQEAVASVKRDQEEDSDPTGTLAVENEYPAPSKTMPSHQVEAIANELLDLAREAVEDMH